MNARRLVPWIVSVAAHAALILVPIAFYDLSPPAGERPLTIDVQLVGAETTGTAARGASGQSGGHGTTAREAATGAKRPRGGTAASVSPRVGRSVSSMDAAATDGAARPAGTAGQGVGASPQVPAAADVLSDLARTGPGPVGGTGGEAGVISGGGAEIGWNGTARRLLRRRDPQFPVVLSAAGQEVEGEARITVSPLGNVTRVEITRSSGYIEIDASVEAALHDYLFARVNGRSDTVGTVRFRFRLEKSD